MRGVVRAKTSDIEKVQQACIKQEEIRDAITLARERTGVQKATPLTENAQRFRQNGERFPEIAQRFQKIGYRFLAEEAFLRTELIDTGRKIVGDAEKLYSFSESCTTFEKAVQLFRQSAAFGTEKARPRTRLHTRTFSISSTCARRTQHACAHLCEG